MGNFSPVRLLRINLYILLVLLTTSCSWLGLEPVFNNDPITGGENASSSILLGVRLPNGFQRYSSHGYISTGANGEKEGLETFRGNLSSSLAATDLYNELTSNGWQLRLFLRKGERSVSLYQKNNELAVLTIHKQGMWTVLEIWAGARLEDGARLSFEQKKKYEEEMDESYTELPGEEYGPLEKPTRQEEKWGSGVEEREP